MRVGRKGAGIKAGGKLFPHAAAAKAEPGNWLARVNGRGGALVGGARGRRARRGSAGDWGAAREVGFLLLLPP